MYDVSSTTKAQITEDLEHIVRVASCIAQLRREMNFDEKEVQGALFLAQYEIDFVNMRIVKYTIGGKPVVADDWVLNPEPYSKTVHKAWALSLLYYDRNCYLPSIMSRISNKPRELFLSISSILCTVLDIDCKQLHDKRFEDVMKSYGFEIIEFEAP